MHVLKLKQILIVVIISLYCFNRIGLPQGNAEHRAVTEDSQHVLTGTGKKIFPAEADHPSPERSSEIMKHEGTQKKPPDENYQTVFAEEEISLGGEGMDVCPLPFSFLFSSISVHAVDRQPQSQEEKGTQDVAPDTKSLQTIRDKGDLVTSGIQEEKDTQKHESQTVTTDKNPSPDVIEKDVASTSDIIDEKNIQESPPPDNGNDQITAIEKDADLPTVSPSPPTLDKEEPLIIEEEGYQTTGMENSEEHENILSEEDDVSSINEETSTTEYQSNTLEEDIPQGMEEESTPSPPPEPQASEPQIETEYKEEVISESNVGDVESPEEESLVNEDEQNVVTEGEVSSDSIVAEEEVSPDNTEEVPHSVTSPLAPSVLSGDRGESLPGEGAGTQTLTMDSELHESIPDNKETTPSEEEELSTNKQTNIIGKQSSPDKEETPLKSVEESGEEKEIEEETESTWQLWHSDPTHNIILAVVITLVAAKIGGWIAGFVRLPGIVGKLIFGMILGNMYLLTGSDYFDFLRTMPFLKIVSYFGTLVLLLTAGLHTDLRALLRVGPSSFFVCLGGVVAPAGLGIIVSYFLLPDTADGAKLLLSILLCNSSTGLLLAILGELKAMNTLEGRVIAGATILTDIVIILTFGIVSGIVVKGGISLLGISISFGTALFFLVVSIVIISKYGEKFGSFLTHKLTEGLNLPIVVILSLLVAFMFGSIGLHTVIGAFIAGLFLRNVKLKDSDDREYRNVESFIRPFYMILVPILFVRVGAQVDLRSFFHMDAVLLGLAITGAAIIGKLFCSICPIEKGINRLAIGIGMATKLEGTLILAGIGRDIGILNDTVFSSLIMVIVLTSTICPFLMKIVLLKKKTVYSENISAITEKKELKKVTVH